MGWEEADSPRGSFRGSKLVGSDKSEKEEEENDDGLRRWEMGTGTGTGTETGNSTDTHAPQHQVNAQPIPTARENQKSTGAM